MPLAPVKMVKLRCSSVRNRNSLSSVGDDLNPFCFLVLVRQWSSNNLTGKKFRVLCIACHFSCDVNFKCRSTYSSLITKIICFTLKLHILDALFILDGIHFPAYGCCKRRQEKITKVPSLGPFWWYNSYLMYQFRVLLSFSCQEDQFYITELLLGQH